MIYVYDITYMCVYVTCPYSACKRRRSACFSHASGSTSRNTGPATMIATARIKSLQNSSVISFCSTCQDSAKFATQKTLI